MTMQSANLPQQPTGSPARSTAMLALAAMRIPHWIKNIFVAAPLLFSGRFTDSTAWLECLAAVAAFCLLSSAIYVINDLIDRNADRLHPVKSRRPIASGEFKAGAAVAIAAILLLAGLAGAVWFSFFRINPSLPLFGAGLLVWTCSYVLLMLLYSFAIKHMAILDVIVIACGFVLRTMAGAAAISVLPSPWLIVCTFCLCLFLAMLKRRGELVESSEEQAPQLRKALGGYSRPSLDIMIAAMMALSLATYCIYCLSPSTVKHFESSNMVFTIPFAVYGLLRLDAVSRKHGGDPFGLICRDLPCWLVGIAYVLLTAAIWTWGRLDCFKILL